MPNQIPTIKPYRWEGLWVFDAAEDLRAGDGGDALTR